jgi:hypothetical protein
MMAAESAPRTSPEIGGMGHSLKRKEDPRFIRGQGTYVDDVQLPGMLYLDIVRSPYAHAKIVKIDATKALAIPGVLAVITGQDLAKYNLHWMPTLMSDTQMVLPVEKVMYQAQEVAAVLATERYIAADGADAVEVQYEPLPVVVDPKKALEPGAPVLRTDKKDKHDNHIWHWEWGDRAATDKAFREAAVTVKQDIYLPRIHVASIETCGCVAQFDKVTGKLTVWMTTQAPHAIRTVFALVAGHVGLEEHKIRIISPDIGGGFGGKVPVYPGYVIAVAASVLTGKPVKWIEDRMENLQADSFARDYHITAELAATKEGKLTALRIKTLADHGYADAAANPSKFPAGLFHVCTGSYDLKAAHVEVDGAYTNKPPGGIAYRCSFRVTEAVHTIERMADLMAHQLGTDPAEFRMKNFVKPEQFPYRSALGWEYDSGNYAGALQKAMDTVGYAGLRKEQADRRARGELMGIGISSFTEIVGAGPSKHFDILGLKTGEVLGEGRAEPGEDDPGDRARGVHEPSARDGGGSRGRLLLRPAEPHLPVRELHLRGRHRQGHGRGEDPSVRRDRRLRQHHQPDDRHRAGPRRSHDGPRARPLRGDLLRRGRQRSGRELRRLSPADGRRDAEMGDGAHDHALAPSPPGGEGRRRVGDGGRAGGDRERGGRRPVAPGRAPRRHPDHAGEGLEAPPRPRRDGLTAVPARSGRPARQPGVPWTGRGGRAG